jgi:galactokinase
VRRAKHFFDENERVPKMRDALIAGNGAEYMRLMNESGRSSEKYLNNIVTSATGDTKLQEGLELSAKLLSGKGAWRVHGGGFAGCVQALMPEKYFPEYKAGMEKKFGAGKCREIKIG